MSSEIQHTERFLFFYLKKNDLLHVYAWESVSLPFYIVSLQTIRASIKKLKIIPQTQT